MILHPKAAAFDDDRLGVMKEPVQNRRREGAVIVEDAGPLFERLVGGQHDGAALVALADDLEKQIGAVLVDGQVADLIQNQKPWPEVLPQFALKIAPFLRGAQLIDDIDGVGKEHRVALQTGGIAQGGGQVGFTQADGAQEDGVGVVFQELQTEKVLHLELVDFLGPVPAELFEGFDDREAGGFDPQPDGVFPALLVLAVDEPGQVFDVSPRLAGGLLGQFVVLSLEERQLEIIELLSKQGSGYGRGF